MRIRHAPAGALASPLAIAAGILALIVAASGAGDGRVELDVLGVLPVSEDAPSILVLREKGAATILPLVLPAVTARELARALNGRERRGALGEAIAKLGGQVREVEIVAAEDTPRGARIRLVQGGRPVEISARPSESVALAVAAGAPVVTTRQVIEESGLTPDDLARAHERSDGRHGLWL
ncbi:bifunctional nuclease family protein [Anaeromyxobacter oryzisoli]|uniref:bifunctional nuclease family protein n=1 Tax=Anaeromyxobacter oryzisoli TaxID=2925408 RepID=UPI001F56D054|nr:bifunctional nuclease domain-containing protein [Anaeromyxobacter sp. SG63]